VTVGGFEDDGYATPLRFRAPERMTELRAELDATLCARPGPFHGDPWSARHQDCRVVYDICASAPLCDAVEAVLGPDLIVWNSVFFVKESGGAAIPWHQDRDFLLLEPDVSVSVWLAIDESTLENGCLQVVPGSHRVPLDHTPRTSADAFDASVEDVDRAKAVPVELRAGEFVLFRPAILHHSAANPSPRRRMGLAIRYTVPGVKVSTTEFFDGYRVLQVRGRDVHGLNPVAPPPVAGLPGAPR
jgi:ectoine hydroxylase-related dioxygenase (phytanoyl-CoA dioxygenase family)